MKKETKYNQGYDAGHDDGFRNGLYAAMDALKQAIEYQERKQLMARRSKLEERSK